MKTEFEKIQALSLFLKGHKENILFDDTRFVCRNELDKIESRCEAIGLSTERAGKELRLQIKQFFTIPVIYYPELSRKFEAAYSDSSFIILDTNGDFCINDPNKDLLCNADANPDFKINSENIWAYYKLLNFLSSEDFADHFNDANREIVIYSSSKGILKIKYDSEPRLNENKISDTVAKIIKVAGQDELKSFVQNALFVFSREEGTIALAEIIERADEIVTAAKRDYTLANKRFDFENFRDSVYKEKEKYFSNIRELINKIFAQAIGVPISIGAAIFSTYKIGDDKFMVLLVLLSFIVYVAFYLRIQFIYRDELQEIEFDFITDFDIIISKSGLDQKIIDKEVVKVKEKLRKSFLLIKWLINVVIGLSILVSCYMTYVLVCVKPTEEKKNNECCCVNIIEQSNNGSLSKICEIGPFIIGTQQLQGDPTNALMSLRDSIIKNNYSEICIMGGVDKRYLRGRVEKTFGDNLSLAQARANLVKDSINYYLKLSGKTTIILTTVHGGNYLGVDSINLSRDRYVKVYGRK